jgi:hypothetical protein
MYNIHSHYENLLYYVQSIVAQPTIVYLHPFGSTSIDNIESLSNCGDGPVIIAYDQEPIITHYNHSLFTHIKENFRTFRDAARPIILLNTEKHSQEKNKIIDEFGFIDASYFFHGLAAADWYRGYQYCKALVPVSQRKINKKFISFNRITGNARTYRSFFVGELAMRDLLKHGHVSYSKICPVHGDYNKNILETAYKYKLPLDYANKIIATLRPIQDNLRIDFQGSIPNGSQTIGPISSIVESFLHVVTETCYWDDKTHLTEKIFKPIVARQPFVLLGCANNLQYLKSYGFKTFDAWWDESYDKTTDPIQRLQQVVKIIESICSRSVTELQNTLIEMQSVLDHNYNLFYSKEFIDNIWHELKINLQSAVAQLPLPPVLRTPIL